MQSNSQLDRSARFSYKCNSCNRCCYNHNIQINPYEVAMLASGLSISTTEFLQEYCNDAGVHLARDASGACVFLDEKEGCTVHPFRPLVCRLYPLGRVLSPENSEYFERIEMKELSEGEFGKSGTVESWLENQSTKGYLEMAEAYYHLFLKLNEKFSEIEMCSEENFSEYDFIIEHSWLDIDGTLQKSIPSARCKEKIGVKEKTLLHIETISKMLIN